MRSKQEREPRRNDSPWIWTSGIEKELAKDEAGGVPNLPFGHEALDRLDALCKEILGDEILPGDSVEFIREARESRAYRE